MIAKYDMSSKDCNPCSNQIKVILLLFSNKNPMNILQNGIKFKIELILSFQCIDIFL